MVDMTTIDKTILDTAHKKRSIDKLIFGTSKVGNEPIDMSLKGQPFKHSPFGGPSMYMTPPEVSVWLFNTGQVSSYHGNLESIEVENLSDGFARVTFVMLQKVQS